MARRQVAEALILALGHSAVVSVVNLGTLRYFIEFSLKEMLRGRDLDLAPLWQVLAAEPGITEEMIAPPLLRIASWGDHLAVKVALPPALRDLAPEVVAGHLARIVIEEPELDAVLGEGVQPQAAGAGTGARGGARAGKAVKPLQPARAHRTASASRPGAAPSTSAEPRRPPRLSPRYLKPSATLEDQEGRAQPADAAASRPDAAGLLQRHRKIVLPLASAALAGALIFLGVQLFGAPGAGQDLSRFAGALKLEAGRRVGYAVTAVIADPRWESMDRSTRRRVVAEIFDALQEEQVRTVVLKGPGGRTRALISIVGGARTVKIE